MSRNEVIIYFQNGQSLYFEPDDFSVLEDNTLELEYENPLSYKVFNLNVIAGYSIKPKDEKK